jgi:hypothetical protein
MRYTFFSNEIISPGFQIISDRWAHLPDWLSSKVVTYRQETITACQEGRLAVLVRHSLKKARSVTQLQTTSHGARCIHSDTATAMSGFIINGITTYDSLVFSNVVTICGSCISWTPDPLVSCTSTASESPIVTAGYGVRRQLKLPDVVSLQTRKSLLWL